MGFRVNTPDLQSIETLEKEFFKWNYLVEPSSLICSDSHIIKKVFFNLTLYLFSGIKAVMLSSGWKKITLFGLQIPRF